MQKEKSRRASVAVPGAPAVDAAVLLARVATRLAEGDDDALSASLSLLVVGLGLRSAVLRDALDGVVLGAAGDLVHAVPHARERVLVASGVVEIPVQAGGRPLAALTVVGARPSHLPPLRAAAAVLALELRRSSARVPLALLEAADAAADRAADALHDGPVQELVVARYAADAAVRGGDATSVRDAVQSSLVSLRRALWMLRPRPTGGESLADVLPQLSSRLQESGRPGLLLDVDTDSAARLSAPAASVCYRLVQEVAGPTGGSATVVLLRAGRDCVRLELDGDTTSLATGPATALWSARARALGAELSVPDRSTGRVVLSIPVPPRNDATPEELRRSP